MKLNATYMWQKDPLVENVSIPILLVLGNYICTTMCVVLYITCILVNRHTLAYILSMLNKHLNDAIIDA